MAIKEEAEQEMQNASTMGTSAPPKKISECPKSTQSTPSCRDLEANLFKVPSGEREKATLKGKKVVVASFR